MCNFCKQYLNLTRSSYFLPRTMYAQNYGGHQFGTWAGQLGDGRAITLGEVLTPQGERWELQLKGAGRTPYSRSADGQAVLRSSLREFLCSEAMHGLGVPTTRALTLVGTGTGVHRDMFYDGHPNLEPGSVVCRTAPSFVRFGTFQLPAERGGEETKLVKVLADYVIKHRFPKLETGPENGRGAVAEAETSGNEGEEGVSGEYNKYAALFKEVAERTGKLVAQWQAVRVSAQSLCKDRFLSAQNVPFYPTRITRFRFPSSSKKDGVLS